MAIGAAQAELRASQVRGGPGDIVSAVVCLVAAIVASAAGIVRGFATLFLGGMLVCAISMLIVRKALRRRAPAPGNPGDLTVLEMTFGCWLNWNGWSRDDRNGAHP